MVRLVLVQSLAFTKLTVLRFDASQSSILEHMYADGAVVVVATLAAEVVVALLGDPVDVTPVGAFVVVEAFAVVVDVCGAFVGVEDDVVVLQSTAHVYFEVTFFVICVIIKVSICVFLP